ncbi:hypothetical protein JOD31_001186 [Methylopila capsulata]|nr:hypothetical protein [Methylopila capsulata]MBM7850961.1 hypothetical protein [Methylopila capsulata]
MHDSTEKPNDPLAEGFCNPPDGVTEPCLTYIARVMELRDFVGFFFNFVKTSVALGGLVPQDARTQADVKAFAVLRYDYSKHRPFVNQIMLSRAIESFDLYLTTTLRDIFLARPEMLKSEGSIDIASVIEAGSYDELILRISERKIHDLSYKSLGELRKFIQSRTGIDLFHNDASFEMTVLASEVRNLIAHNDCVVNDIFRARIKRVSSQLDVSETGRVQITDEWLRRASYTLDGIVFRFDQLAAEKFALQTVNRMGAFILRT